MSTIPWYQSNTLRGLLVALVAFALQLAGLDAQFPDAAGYVGKVLDLVTLGAMMYAGYARVRQPTPPISNAAAAKMQAGKVRSPLLVGLLAGALALLAFTGCATTPQSVVSTACQKQASYQVERCAMAVADLYAVYQQRGLEIVQDTSTPAEVREAIKTADAAATPVMRELLASTRVYLQVKADLAAGTTTEDKVVIANEQLEQWVQLALPRVTALINAFGG